MPPSHLLPQLLDEVALLVRRHGSEFAFGLTTELDSQVHGLGLALYRALGGSRQYQDVREGLIRHSLQQESRHRVLLTALGAAGTIPSAGTVPSAGVGGGAGAWTGAGPAAPSPEPEPPAHTGTARPVPLPTAADYPPKGRRSGFLPRFRKRRDS